MIVVLTPDRMRAADAAVLEANASYRRFQARGDKQYVSKAQLDQVRAARDSAVASRDAAAEQARQSTQVAAYALLIPLFSAIQTTLEAIGTFLWPHYTRLRVRGEFAARTVYRHAVVFVGLGVVAGALLWLVAPLYTQIAANTQAPVSLAIAFGLLAVAQSLTLAFTSALTTPQLLRAQGIGLVLAVAVKVALAPLVLPAYGATGVVGLGVLVVLMIQVPSLIIILQRNFGRRRLAPAAG